MRKNAESLRRWLADPRRGNSLLPFAVGVSIALGVLWLREPALFVEPTLRGDEIICFAAQYGEGKTLYRHNGAAHLLPMLTSWTFVHALPEVAVPYDKAVVVQGKGMEAP